MVAGGRVAQPVIFFKAYGYEGLFGGLGWRMASGKFEGWRGGDQKLRARADWAGQVGMKKPFQ
jgi:hypothetical protein